MTKGGPGRSGFHVSTRLLAKKGGAEPLPTTGNPIILSDDRQPIQTDGQYLTDAVIDATLDILVEPPRKGRPPQGAASLTDLLDPTLIDSGRRKTDEFEG
jgi:hypothetical protein